VCGITTGIIGGLFGSGTLVPELLFC